MRDVKVDPGKFGTGYSFSGRTIEYHRAQIREALGFDPSLGEREFVAPREPSVRVDGVDIEPGALGESLGDARSEVSRQCRRAEILTGIAGQLEQVLHSAAKLGDSSTARQLISCARVGSCPSQTRRLIRCPMT